MAIPLTTQFYAQIEEHLRCPIQSTILKNAVVTNEGHSFDTNSLTNWRTRNPNCPMSVNPIKAIAQNKALIKVAEEWTKRKRTQTQQTSLHSFLGFRCEYSEQIMEDPMIDSHGHTFEGSFITKWLNKNENFCPLDEDEPITFLVKNIALKNCIDTWKYFKAKHEAMHAQPQNMEMQVAVRNGIVPLIRLKDQTVIERFLSKVVHSQEISINDIDTANRQLKYFESNQYIPILKKELGDSKLSIAPAKHLDSLTGLLDDSIFDKLCGAFTTIQYEQKHKDNEALNRENADLKSQNKDLNEGKQALESKIVQKERDDEARKKVEEAERIKLAAELKLGAVIGSGVVAGAIIIGATAGTAALAIGPAVGAGVGAAAGLGFLGTVTEEGVRRDDNKKKLSSKEKLSWLEQIEIANDIIEKKGYGCEMPSPEQLKD